MSPRRSSAGDTRIIGVMIESHLDEGRQDLKPGVPLERGVSITDACLGWATPSRCSKRLRERCASGGGLSGASVMAPLHRRRGSSSPASGRMADSRFSNSGKG